MDSRLNKNISFILMIVIAAATVILLLHTTESSFGLYLLACAYVALVFIRDFVLRIGLDQKKGILFACLQLLLATAITIWSESFFAQIYILILIGEFTFYHSKAYSLTFTVVSYACNVLSLLIYRQFPPFEQIFYLIPRVIEYAAIFGISLLAKIAFQQKNQLAKDNEQLHRASIELERKAKLEERTRISREIHDSVGHTLTSALTGLQTAAYAIEKNNYPLVKEMIERSKEYVLRGLDDVRSSVHLLHEHVLNHPFVPELQKLMHETAAQTNVKIDYDIDEHLPEFPPMIELTLYRALQEGLSNGIRHGAGTYFYCRLTFSDDRIRFVLSDNGKPPSQVNYGFGLNAMKARVEDAGGTLTIVSGNHLGGLTLEIHIPFQMKDKREV